LDVDPAGRPHVVASDPSKSGKVRGFARLSLSSPLLSFHCREFVYVVTWSELEGIKGERVLIKETAAGSCIRWISIYTCTFTGVSNYTYDEMVHLAVAYCKTWEQIEE
jgi:hypothetical protein